MSRVLVVDDDDFARAVFVEMLASLGVTDVSTTRNGVEALRTLRELPVPDLIICDVYMPDRDGVELMEDLAARQYPGGVMLVSGMDLGMLELARTLATRRGLKVRAACRKPVTREQLAAALNG